MIVIIVMIIVIVIVITIIVAVIVTIIVIIIIIITTPYEDKLMLFSDSACLPQGAEGFLVPFEEF